MGFGQNWEEFFPEAILSVEELLATSNPVFSQKSKLRLALENNFLKWNDYIKWATNMYACPAINSLDEDSLSQLQRQYAESVEGYSQYPMWSSELIPLAGWDGNLLVLGLEYTSEVFNSIPHAVFIFCSHENLAKITKSQESRPILVPLDSPAKDTTKENISDDHVWQNLTNQHEDFSMIARKKFDAYIVLRATADGKTELYKMDEDLEKEELSRDVFVYDLNGENPFANVYQNHFTDTFNINQLGLKILDFKYACITAIKLGSKVVGFVVGFKTTHLSQDDITTLESIPEKAV